MSGYDCNHCPETFPDTDDGEDAYLTHLAEQHPNDLSRIDERHIEQQSDITLSDGPTQGELILQSTILTIGILATGAIVYFLFL